MFLQIAFPISGTFDDGVLNLLKVLVLLGLLFYIFFAVLIIRQTSLMTRTVQGKLDRVIRIMSWAHFTFAVFIFVLSYVIL